jgi:hypothetical protein
MAALKNKMGGGAAVAEASSTLVNLETELKIIGTNYERHVKEGSAAFPDHLLKDTAPEVAQALAAVAKMIGFDSYDPDLHSTIFVACNKKTKVSTAYVPRLAAYGWGVAILWSDVVIPIPDETPLNSKDLYELKVDKDSIRLSVNARGYNMPINVKLADRTKFKEGEWDVIARNVEKAGELMLYLDRGDEIIKWVDIQEGVPMTVYQVQPNYGEKEGVSYLNYCLALVEAEDGRVFRVYCPGAAEDWLGFKCLADEPVILTKTGAQQVDDNRGNSYTIKRVGGADFKKLRDLKEDTTYTCIEFGWKDAWEHNGKLIAATPFVKLIDPEDGSVLQCDSNRALQDEWASGTPETRASFSEATPGYLHVKKITKAASGMVVSLDLKWPEGIETASSKAARIYMEGLAANPQKKGAPAKVQPVKAEPELPFAL